jgi:hypothetical protein
MLISVLVASSLMTWPPEYACLKKTGEWVLGIHAGECLRIGGVWRRFDSRLKRWRVARPAQRRANPQGALIAAVMGGQHADR